MPVLESQYSPTLTATATDLIAPAQVTNFAYTVAQGQVLLTWNAVSTNNDASPLEDLAGYRVFRKKTAGDAFTEISTVAAGVNGYTDSTMLDGTSYIYAVSAFDDEVVPNEGAKSEELAVKTITSIPAAPTANTFDRKIVIHWTSVKDELEAASNENLAGYNVYRATVAGEYTKVGTVDADTLLFEDTTVTNDVTYTYAITSFDNSVA